MAMPQDLVLVRHGQSELNIANRRSRNGDDSAWTDEFRARHDADCRLTDLGIEQAHISGAWITENIGAHFDRYYSSFFPRAIETAANLGLEGAEWRDHFALRERDWGDMAMMTFREREDLYAESLKRRDSNSLLWRPPNGESMLELMERLYSQVLGTLHREMDGKRVIIVSHGEAMLAFRLLLERMSPERWSRLDRSHDSKQQIHNCQILHYTRKDPVTGEVSPRIDWMRSTWPYQVKHSPNTWEKIVRPTYTNEQLLQRVGRIERLIAG